jgi:hypothetical protein
MKYLKQEYKNEFRIDIEEIKKLADRNTKLILHPLSVQRRKGFE